MKYSQLVLEKAEQVKKEYQEIIKLISYNEVQADINYFRSLVKRKNEIENIVVNYVEFQNTNSQIEILQNEKEKETDNELIDYMNQEMEKLLPRKHHHYIVVKHLLMGKKFSNAIVEINTQDQDLIFKVIKMYALYAEKNYLKYNIEYQTDYQAVINIDGNLAYERFVLESGKHIIIKDKCPKSSFHIDCYKSLTNINAFDEDEIKIDIFRSQGAGGQNVNKVETAVRATHLKTNISVVCQDERSQRQNKERAIKNLKSKVFDYYESLRKKEIEQTKRDNRTKVVRYYDFDNQKVIQNKKSEELNRVLEGNINIFADEILLKE